MKRLPILCLVLLLATACGGGSTGTTAPLVEPEVDAAQQHKERVDKALAILQVCAQEHAGRFLELVELLQGMSDTGATQPEFKLSGVNLAAASVDFTADLDVDGTDDVTGTLTFTDAAGNPTFPFNPLDVLTMPLLDLLATVPDGTILIVDFTLVGTPVTSGVVSLGFVDGQPATASGEVTTDGTDCDTTFTFEDIDATALLAGDYPTTTVDMAITSTEGDLDGTVTFDGTTVVVIDTAVEGEALQFELDLETGVITEVT